MHLIKIEVEVEVHEPYAFTEEYGEPWTLGDIRDGLAHGIHAYLVSSPGSNAFRPNQTEPDNHAVRTFARLED